jgi:hypothetical protein
MKEEKEDVKEEEEDQDEVGSERNEENTIMYMYMHTDGVRDTHYTPWHTHT